MRQSNCQSYRQNQNYVDMRKTRALIILAFSLLAGSCQAPQPTFGSSTSVPKRPKNVILMIGDGMGLAQISAAMYHNKNKLHLERMPVIGFHKSHAADNLITDSAAGATAFATGEKTFVGAIGMNKDSTVMRTILEQAEDRGLATGLVATSTIVHATPASFIAHQHSREMYEEIAADFLNVDIDLLIGGGKYYFDNREKDDRNLYMELVEKGYMVDDYFKTDFFTVKPDLTRNFAFFTANKQPLTAAAGRKYLPYASKLAVDFLSGRSKKGFFLMIEGSQIDWGGHANDGEMIIEEVLDFDRAIQRVLRFAERDGETLVVITADHETGGMAINPGSAFGDIKAAFNTNGHTATMVPVFAFGPYAENFAGIYENVEIYHKMKDALGFSELPVEAITTTSSR